MRVRFWIETVLACASTLLLAFALVSREWIEAMTGFDPDNHDGSLEWAIVACLGVATSVAVAAAHAEWRRAATTTAET